MDSTRKEEVHCLGLSSSNACAHSFGIGIPGGGGAGVLRSECNSSPYEKASFSAASFLLLSRLISLRSVLPVRMEAPTPYRVAIAQQSCQEFWLNGILRLPAVLRRANPLPTHRTFEISDLTEVHCRSQFSPVLLKSSQQMSRLMC